MTEFRGAAQTELTAQPQSPATELTRGGQEEDKAQPQSPATEPSHRVQGRGQ